MKRAKRLVCHAALLALVGGAGPLRAEEGARDIKAAEALFREGRALLVRGEIAAACEKLEQSRRLDESGGTLMNLADCHQKLGKTATAWAEFLAAEQRSRSDGRAARAAEAKRRAAALESVLSRLTILAPRAVPGLEIRRDDQLVTSDQLGVAVPVDPGAHRIVASAPGYEPTAIDMTLGAQADSQTLTLPELQPLPGAEALAPPSAPATTSAEPVPASSAPPVAEQPATAPLPPDEGSSRVTLGWVAGGSGLALAGAGTVFYFLALSANSRAEEGCAYQSHYRCSEAAIQAGETRDTYATLATVGGALGLAGMGVGAWLLLTSPSSETPAPASATRRTPRWSVATRGTRIELHGVFP
jgi:hypothetical protein